MSCNTCSKPFSTSEREKKFLASWDLPCPPKHCPDCRRQRRLAFRNERRFYYTTCPITGKKIVSLYPKNPKRKLTVYEQSVWWDESQWDPFEYGRDFDFSRPFFDQIKELQEVVPRPSLHNTNVENALYGNHTISNKDCYLNFGSDLCESVQHTYWAIRCRNCLDVSITYDCELCYDCVDLRNSFNCHQVDNSEIMTDCQYCYDCKSCQDCFGCVGLRHKRYHFLNEPISREEYLSRMKYLEEHPETLQVFLKKYELLKREAVYAANKNIQSEDVVGDRLFRCRQCADSFDLEKCDEVDYSSFGFEGVSSQDNDFFGRIEKVCESISSFGQYDCLSTILCHHSHDVLYSEYCISSHHLFGCIALHHEEYCILNKRYSKEEYEVMSKKIIQHMKETGEWGEFFPVEMSPYPYNITVAQRYYPLSKEDIEARSWMYEDPSEDSQQHYEGPFYEMPENESEVSKLVIGRVLKCQMSGRPYKITPQEFGYLRNRGYPLPRLHPDMRAERRLLRHNPLKMWERHCEACGKKTSGSFDPAQGFHINCQDCFEERAY